jgi:hypothetical protein
VTSQYSTADLVLHRMHRRSLWIGLRIPQISLRIPQISLRNPRISLRIPRIGRVVTTISPSRTCVLASHPLSKPVPEARICWTENVHVVGKPVDILCHLRTKTTTVPPFLERLPQFHFFLEFFLLLKLCRSSWSFLTPSLSQVSPFRRRRPRRQHETHGRSLSVNTPTSINLLIAV